MTVTPLIALNSTPLSERKSPYPGHISESFPPYQSNCSGIKSSGALFYKFSIRTLSLFSSMFAKMFVFRQNRSLFVYFLFHFISFLGKYHWSRFSWAECRYNFCANISAPLVFSFLYSFLFKETHPNLYCITIQTYLTVKIVSKSRPPIHSGFPKNQTPIDPRQKLKN